MLPAFALLAASLTAGVELTVGELPATGCRPHRVTVTCVRQGAAVELELTLSIVPPARAARTTTRRLNLPADGRAEATFDYELYEPGEHKLTFTATAGGAVLARETRSLTPADLDTAPVLFPNHYRQSLTVVGGRAVTSSYGPLATKEGRATVAASGDGWVEWPSGDGRRRCEVHVPPRAAGPAVCEVGADNRLKVGGRTWFPLGIYFSPYTEPLAAELAEAGFDLVQLDGYPGPELKTALDFYRRHGLRAWVPLGNQLNFAVGDPEAKRKALRELAASAGDHPALALWESVDEPAWGGTPSWGLRDGYRFLRELDPRRPIWTNHAPRNAVSALAWYNQATDIAGCDVYPVPMPQKHSDLPVSTLAAVGAETDKSLASVAGEKPVFMVLQGFAWDALPGRKAEQAVYPTFAESRYMAYDAVVSGASGLLWWGVRYAPRPSPFWSDLKAVVSEVAAIRRVLEAPDAAPPATLVEGQGVRFVHRRIGADEAVMVVNRSAEPVKAALRVTGRAWRALFDDPQPSLLDGLLRVDLPAWGVAVLTTSPDWRPVRKSYAAEAAAARPPQPLPRQAGNAIPNPSFEAETDGLPDGWQVRFPFTAALEPGAHEGQRAFRLRSSAAGATPLAVMRPIEVKGDRKVRLSGWMRTDTPGVKGRFYAEWVIGGRFHGRVLPWTEPTAEWRRYELVFDTTPDPKGGLYVVVQVDGPGSVLFDELKLEEVDAP